MKKITASHFGEESVFHVQADLDGVVRLYRDGVPYCGVSCDLSKVDTKLVEASAKLPEGVFYHDANSSFLLTIMEVAVEKNLIEAVSGFPIIALDGSYAGYRTYRIVD